MFILGQALSGSGIDFISAKAKHNKIGLQEVHILVRNSVDVTRMKEWCAANLPAVVDPIIEIATPQQISDHDEICP